MKNLYMLPMSMLVMFLLLVDGVSPAAADNFKCRGTIEVGKLDNVVVPDTATCTLNSTEVKGNIIVKTGAHLIANSVTVDGNIQAEGHASVVVSDSSVGGSVQVKQGGSAEVTGSQIKGDLQLEQNNGRFVLSGNTIGGNLQAKQNSGELQFSFNTIDGALQCQANNPPPMGGGNTASSREGQCKSLIASANELKPEVAVKIDQEIATYKNRCAGTSIGLVYDNTIVYTKSYGSHRIDQVHVWASVSKTLTGLITMRLVERGELTLSTPIWDYVPEYATLIPKQYKVKPLNLRHLLTHMGGVRHSGQVHTPQIFVAEPDTQYIYSTHGFGIVGEILTSNLRQAYPTIVKREIADLITADSLIASKGFVAPGAMVKSNIQDFSKYAIGIMQHTFVSSDTFYNKMLVKYAIGYQGLAFHMFGSGNSLAVTHGGSNGRQKAYLYIKPRLKRGVVVFCDAAYSWSGSTELQNLSKSLDSILASSSNPILNLEASRAAVSYNQTLYLPVLIKQ